MPVISVSALEFFEAYTYVLIRYITNINNLHKYLNPIHSISEVINFKQVDSVQYFDAFDPIVLYHNHMIRMRFKF